MASVVRSTALRAGGACVRCRKGKTKCVYENGRAPSSQWPIITANPQRGLVPEKVFPASASHRGTKEAATLAVDTSRATLKSSGQDERELPSEGFPRFDRVGIAGTEIVVVVLQAAFLQEHTSASFFFLASRKPRTACRYNYTPELQPSTPTSDRGLFPSPHGLHGIIRFSDTTLIRVVQSACFTALLKTVGCICPVRFKTVCIISTSLVITPFIVIPQRNRFPRPPSAPNTNVAECERVISKTLPSCVAFHKPSFLQQVKQAALEPTIVNGLLTTAARSSPSLIRRYGGQSGAAGAADHFAAKASRQIMENFDAPNLTDIQALCLLVIHEWGNRNAVRAYIYLGQAARMAQMFRIINAHQTQSPAEQFLQDESFRRAVWLIYILDCFLTSSPGRHPALTSHDIKDVPLPCLDMNYHFGSPVAIRTLSGAPPRGADPNVPLGELGEFAHIVLATQVWRNTVEMLTTTTRSTFSEETCQQLEAEIDLIRQSLPMHFLDKPGQINLHITMGSGFTYAMIHCLLHCATIFVNRRRLLQIVTSEGFTIEQWHSTYHAHHQTVEAVLAASHSIITMLSALESGADKDAILCFPIFMLFSSFIASSTTAYLSLKGLTPPNIVETAAHIVREGLRFLTDALEAWPLVNPWHRHLSVMAKILTNSDSISGGSGTQGAQSVKDEGSATGENTGDGMDYIESDPQPARATSEAVGRESEPPQRRPGGFTTVNGGSAGASTPATASPPQMKAELPERPASAGAAAQLASGTGGQPSTTASQPDMTPTELCRAFENQLLELDDLAAFMGGGV
ncbi:hypothetical protein MKZ38_007725 [Zalerion maritima]|uniref:Xylanolytic transcriptional activator regulatory domain-containing protein n=1 Tax=Zalerion maritima TaxID=339359 RepID=A0AAD5RHG0_9PEZI|nr:hypothetical protein MKZ38_007725 [Zalerion maritima]